MLRIPPLPYRKVSRALAALGFRAVRQRGSHVFFRHPDGRTTLVPCRPGFDLDPSLIRKFIDDCGVAVDEFLSQT